MIALDGRRYLLGQAERYDWVELWPRVVGTRAALIEALGGVSDEQARWKPPAGLVEGDEDEWSILQVARHVLGWTYKVAEHIEAAASGRQPGPAGPARPVNADARLAEIRRAIIEASEHLASIRERLPPQPDETTTIEHQRFGPLPARAWFAFARLHDLDHIGQVKGIKAAEGYPS